MTFKLQQFLQVEEVGYRGAVRTPNAFSSHQPKQPLPSVGHSFSFGCSASVLQGEQADSTLTGLLEGPLWMSLTLNKMW